MNEDQIGARCSAAPRALCAPVASGDVGRVGAMAAAACVADRRMEAERAIGIVTAQGGIDFLARIEPPIAEPVGIFRIVRSSLVPERHQPRGAIFIDEIRMSEVEPEIEGRQDCAASGEMAGSAGRGTPARRLYRKGGVGVLIVDAE